jgi:hypothetical protein
MKPLCRLRGRGLLNLIGILRDQIASDRAIRVQVVLFAGQQERERILAVANEPHFAAL